MDIYAGLQPVDFLLAAAAGFLLGGIYDALRFAGTVFSLKGTAARDILFMILASVVTFLLCLCVSYGYPRLVLLLGEALGFALYMLTLGLLTPYPARALRRLLELLQKKAAAPFFRLLGRIGRKMRDSVGKTGKKLKKRRKVS